MPALRFSAFPAVLAIAALVVGGAVAAPVCEEVSGDFITDLYLGTECPDAVPQCFHAQLRGGIDAPAWSVIRGATPAPTLEAPTRTLFAMSHTVFANGGNVVTSDDLYVDIQPLGPSPFTSVIRFISGTGAMEGVSGQIATAGWYDFAAGHGEGVYTGRLCTG